MLQISKEFGPVMAAFLVVGISQTFVGSYSMVFFQRLIDSFPSARQFSDLTFPLAGYIALTILNHLLIYAEGYPRSLLNNGVYQWGKLHALKKIASIDFLAYQNLGTGNLIQLIENGSDATRNILMGFYLEILRGILPQLVISLILIHYYDPTLFLIILLGYGLLYLIAYYLMIFWRKEVERMLENQEQFSKFSVRAFMELVVFRINGRFKAELERVRGISDEIVRSKARIYLLQELFYTGFAFLIFFIQAGVVLHQAGLIMAGQSTVGTLVALVTFVGGVFGPITGFSMAYVNYKMNAVTYMRFQSLFSLPNDEGLSRGAPLHLTSGCIELHEVSYSYDTHAVLDNFTLKIQGCQTTALVGESGGGKSTLIRLVLGLLKPTQGSVIIDGQDLKEVNLETYYREVAYIPQDPPIFDGSLRENMVFDLPVSAARLAEVIQQVDLAGLVQKLPEGVNTMVGERGIKLSGGERQRLAFARLLLHDPKIVILDEPTSSLDSLTEDFITRSLRTFLTGKTIILVAHRLQTVVSADTIIVLNSGQIAQRGDFHALVSQPGIFKELWDKQSHEVSSQS